MAGDEVADFIQGRLMTDHKLVALRQTWEEIPRSATVQAVDATVTKGKSKGKGHKGKGRTPTPPSSPKREPEPPRGTYTAPPPATEYKGGGPSQPQHSQPDAHVATTSGYCGFCHSEGRPHAHPGSTCGAWKTFMDARAAVCISCQSGGRPSKHDYRSCPHARWGQGKGKGQKGEGKGRSSPQGRGEERGASQDQHSQPSQSSPTAGRGNPPN